VHFVLEAKGMKHEAMAGYRIKQIFKKTPRKQAVDGLSARAESTTLRDENYYVMRIKQDPQDLENYRALGEYYLDNENYPEAGNVFEYLINHDPGNSSYYAKHGFSKLRQELFEEAAHLFEKSVALDATHPNRYYNLALAYEGAERYQEAYVAAEQAVALEPLNKKYHALLDDLDNHRKE
jgi:tetratricopeptide (TPR) repeat protein